MTGQEDVESRRRTNGLMIRIDAELTPEKLRSRIERVFEISAGKIRAIEKAFDASRGSPVFTAQGVYTARAMDRVDTGLPVRLGTPPV